MTAPAPSVNRPPHVADQLDSKVFVKVADGTSLETAAAAVERAAEAYAQAVVQDREEFAAATGAHDEMLNMVYALLLHQPAVDDDGVEGCPAPSRARRRARATR